jgi:hypothetical protein
VKQKQTRIDELLALSVSATSVRIDGRYTLPRTYGVYRLENTSDADRRFRFGNHPVRQEELIREYGAAILEAIYLEREHAMELASLRNAAG